MELAEKHRTLAFSGQHNELEEQAKWARIDTLDAHVLMAIARKKLEGDKGADHVFVGHSSEEVSKQRQLQHGNDNYGNRNYARGQYSGRRNRGSRYTSYHNKRAFGLHNF
ncbi:unnamed protein product [Heligmosomoides polygyrus]|uniref:Uncharacterized protein n=1 Tax=Heligmosomoides polygyrus TaxID=6339 RepID=A0A183GAX7_HELPZ|nr:unnamed protein product [Heligmosomoides polygyrus]